MTRPQRDVELLGQVLDERYPPAALVAREARPPRAPLLLAEQEQALRREVLLDMAYQRRAA